MGRAWKFGDDVSTDAIIPGRYLTSNDPEELAKHVFESERPDFSEKVKDGDFVVAGENFGCGSSREHAPLAIIGSGVKAVIAESFARIFYRNSINLGLLVLEMDEVDNISDGDELELKEKEVIDKTNKKSFEFKKHPQFINEIVQKGGLLEYIGEEKDV